MPYLLRPNSKVCRDFMKRPTAQVCRFPTGRDFYFTLPIDVDWLDLMSPVELEYFYGCLSCRLTVIAYEVGRPGVGNVLAVQAVILRRREEAMALGPFQKEAWHDGYGIPIFDHSQRLVDFVFDWDSIELEGEMGIRNKIAMMRAESNGLAEFDSIDMYSEGYEADEFEVSHWGENGDEAFEIRRNGESELFSIHGGIFQDHAQWMRIETTLTDYELDLLHDGALKILNLPNGAWRFVEGNLMEDLARERSDTPCTLSPSDLTYLSGSQRRTPTPSPTSGSYPETHCCSPVAASDISFTGTNESENMQQTKVYVYGDCQQPVNIFGTTFRNYDEWRQFKEGLTEVALDLLTDRVLQLKQFDDGRVVLTRGPNAGSQFAQARKDAVKRDKANHDREQPSQPSGSLEPRASMHSGIDYVTRQQERTGRSQGQNPNTASSAGNIWQRGGCGENRGTVAERHLESVMANRQNNGAQRSGTQEPELDIDSYYFPSRLSGMSRTEARLQTEHAIKSGEIRPGAPATTNYWQTAAELPASFPESGPKRSKYVVIPDASSRSVICQQGTHSPVQIFDPEPPAHGHHAPIKKPNIPYLVECVREVSPGRTFIIRQLAHQVYQQPKPTIILQPQTHFIKQASSFRPQQIVVQEQPPPVIVHQKRPDRVARQPAPKQTVIQEPPSYTSSEQRQPSRAIKHVTPHTINKQDLDLQVDMKGPPSSQVKASSSSAKSSQSQSTIKPAPTTSHPRNRPGASSRATDTFGGVPIPSQSKPRPYQAYAASSSDVSPQPSPSSWRDV